MQARLFATSFSLLCFAAAIFAGALAGNASATILGRGLAVLGLAYVAGRVLETVARAADWSPVGLGEALDGEQDFQRGEAGEALQTAASASSERVSAPRKKAA